MRRGARRVELDAVHAAGELGARDLLGRRVVGEVERHQRLELCIVRELAEDALAVMQRLRGGAQRRLEIGHHDRAGEAPRRVGEHRRHRRPVAQMHMEIVWPPEGDAIHRGDFTWLAPAPFGKAHFSAAR